MALDVTWSCNRYSNVALDVARARDVTGARLVALNVRFAAGNVAVARHRLVCAIACDVVAGSGVEFPTWYQDRSEEGFVTWNRHLDRSGDKIWTLQWQGQGVAGARDVDVAGPGPFQGHAW